jgi:ABC-type transport system involved in multi-copper enzyme maturation permease subunit
MVDALRSEWSKARTLRSTWVTVLTIVMVGAMFAVMFAGAAGRQQEDTQVGEPIHPFNWVFRALIFVQLVVAYFGARAVTVEYATGTMAGGLTAVPRRGRVLAAKAVVCAVVALVAGWVTALTVFLVGRTVLTAVGMPAYTFGEPGVARALVGVGLLMAVMSLFGLAIGLLVRSTAGSMTIVTLVALLIPAMSSLYPAWLASFVVKYWPTTAGGRLISVTAEPPLLPPWPGFALFCACTAVLLLVAWRQLEGLRHIDRRRHVALRQALLDVVVAQHLVDGGDVERAIVEQHPVRLHQLLGDDARGALAVLVHRGVDPPDRARSLKDGALVAPRHHACAGIAVGPELDLESRRYLNLVERDVLRRRHGHLAGMSGQMRVRHALGEVASHGLAAFRFLRAGRLLGPGGRKRPDRNQQGQHADGDSSQKAGR